MLRATKSRDIRAPNLSELYASGAILAFGASDYGLLANGVPTQYNTLQVTQGNSSLTPELGDTKTYGFTLQPDFLKGFKASVDYFSINLRGAIAAVTAQNIINGCYGVLGNTVTPAYCALIQRDATTGRITAVTSTNFNLQSLITKGIDYEASYRFSLADLMGSVPGNLTLRLLATDVKNLITNNGFSVIDRAGEIGGSGGTSTPHWRFTLSGTYQNGPLTGFAETRYVGKGKYDVTFGPNDIANNDIPSRTYLDASLQYVIKQTALSRLQVYAKVNNVFDREPPILANANQNVAPTNAALYDVAGRTFFVGARFVY